MPFKWILWILTGLRKDKGWNQHALAGRLHVAADTLRRWEIGETSPRVCELEEWAALVGHVVRFELVSSGSKARSWDIGGASLLRVRELSVWATKQGHELRFELVRKVG
jgi:transcriptional regulator with XRE-family HTH domain